jgi:hypothetical protein
LDLNERYGGRLEKSVQRGDSYFILFIRYYLNNQIEDEIGRACNICGEIYLYKILVRKHDEKRRFLKEGMAQCG